MMHHLNYILVFALVVIVIALIVDAHKSAPPTPTIKKCPACGSPATLSGDFVDSYVRCSNVNCAMTGPKGQTDEEAVESWNKITMGSK